jgi:hypothetical protein
MALPCHRLLQYAIYMYWMQFEMLPIGLGSILGLYNMLSIGIGKGW